MRYAVCFALLILLTFSALSVAQDGPRQTPAWDVRADSWVATDALDRVLPGFAEVGPPHEDRWVGIFYFLWLDRIYSGRPWDVTEVLAQEPSQHIWPMSTMNWGESEDGYYISSDPYVLRKHCNLLVDAGVDTLIFDTSNAVLYIDTLKALCDTYLQIRAEGGKTPQLTFLIHNDAVPALFEQFFSIERYRELWFYWKGKPLALPVREPSGLGQEYKDFFTLRHCWAWTSGQDTWSWVTHWPQQYGWHESPDLPEELSVSIAQHPTTNYGRSNLGNVQPPYDEDFRTGTEQLGLYFEQQWLRALEVDPEFIYVTGWNEWIAGHYIVQPGTDTAFLGKQLNLGDYFHVDSFNEEYSRDSEPLMGGYGDNYYYQLASNIRRYKGIRVPEPVGEPKTIALDGSFADWAEVGPEYRDHLYDPVSRDWPGESHLIQYVNNSGRNDLVAFKVAQDADFVYFYAKTRQPLTPYTDKGWMQLYLDTDQSRATGWEGYDYAVNVVGPRTATRTTLARATGKPAEAKLRRVAPAELGDASNKGSIEENLPPSLEGSQWIWGPGTGLNAPPGKIWLRKNFDLPDEQLAEARLIITCDNSFVLFVNGQQAATGDAWDTLVEVELTPLLRPGPNVLSIEATNDGDGPNFAGLVATLKARLLGASPLTLRTDSSWKVLAEQPGAGWTEADFEDSSWQRARELGAYGNYPWIKGVQPANPLLFTWLPGSEARYLECDLGAPMRLTSTRVEWATGTFPVGELATPTEWRLYYEAAGRWVEVPNPSGYANAVAQGNRTTFDPIIASKLRLELRAPEESPVGLFKWEVTGCPAPAGEPPVAWEELASDIQYRALGSELELALPRSLLGEGSEVSLDFHWADNPQSLYDLLEFSINGDSAPERRYNYRYGN